MSADTWSTAELTKCEWSSYWKDFSGQPEMTFTDDEDLITYFTEGQCAALAYEIHQLTGWTLALISSQPVGSDDYSGHVFIMDSDGMVIDIKGKRTLDDVKEEWYFCPHIHRFFTLTEFKGEMRGWDMDTKFDRDAEAKLWAEIIVRELT